jgi:rhodanese-related sulfurtransferase
MHLEPSVDLSAHEALDAVRSGALLLDVRESFEWVSGHAPDAVHIPMSELGGRVGELPTDRTIVCVCHVGGRSAVVVQALNRGGWSALNLAGGMEAWLAAGLPIVDDAGQPGSVS